MAYAIPGETPRSRYAQFATWPLIPFLGGLVIGTLPAIVWMVANAWFLGCRDARRQTKVAVTLYGIVKLAGAADSYLNETGIMRSLTGNFGDAVTFLVSQLNWLTYLLAMAWLQERQHDAAYYLSSVRQRQGLWRGLPLFIIFVPANFIIYTMVRKELPYIAGVYGAQGTLDLFGLGGIVSSIFGMVASK